MRTIALVTVLLCSLTGFTQSVNFSKSENKPEILTFDVYNFWDAFDHLKDCHRPGDSVECITSRYFETGTAGFTEFIDKYRYTPKDYVKAIAQHPGFYNSIRKNTLLVNDIENEIEQFSRKMTENFPSYQQKKICFAISPIQDEGTTTDQYILIGTDIIASSKAADLSEFGNDLMGKILARDTNVRDRLIFEVARESVGDLQVNADRNNYELLNHCLMVGSADFVASLLTGVNESPSKHRYGDLHQQELWSRFIADVENNRNYEDWINNRDRVEKDIPDDMGYYIGYKIAEKYYNTVADKKQALHDILNMKDAKVFLQKSGYRGL
jgi:hypothetical protein